MDNHDCNTCTHNIDDELCGREHDRQAYPERPTQIAERDTSSLYDTCGPDGKYHKEKA